MGNLIGLLIAVGGFLAWRHWRKLSTERAKKKFVFQAIVIGLLVVILLLAISGRIHPLGAVFAAMIPILKVGLNLLIRWLPLFGRIYGANYAKPRTLKTAIVEVTINFANSQISGTVLAGPHAGAELDSLSENQLAELLEYCKAQDAKSVYLLRMYMAKRFQQKTQSNGSSETASSSSMSIEEAAEILGISIAADKEEINQAHRRLIGRVHPDKGGNDYLASLLNRARDLMLEKVK